MCDETTLLSIEDIKLCKTALTFYCVYGDNKDKIFSMRDLRNYLTRRITDLEKR